MTKMAPVEMQPVIPQVIHTTKPSVESVCHMAIYGVCHPSVTMVILLRQYPVSENNTARSLRRQRSKGSNGLWSVARIVRYLTIGLVCG